MNAARADRQAETEVSADPQSHQQPRWAEPHDPAGVESPARRLQIELRESLAKPQAGRWSARRSVVVIFATNAVLWTVAIAGLRSLL